MSFISESDTVGQASVRVSPVLSYFQRRVPWVLAFCAVGMLLPFVHHIFQVGPPVVLWVIDLIQHWQWLFVLLGLLGTMVMVLGNKKWLFYLLLLPLPWISATAQIPVVAGSHKVLDIASANVNLKNHDVTPLRVWLNQTKPDLVALQEVSPQYAAGLKSFDDYPYQLIQASRFPNGIALLSRYPLLDTRIIDDANEFPRIEGKVQIQGVPISFAILHPLPPISAELRQVRDQVLKEAITQMREGRGFIAGDLNATPWSSAFQVARQAGWYRTTGLAPTWPVAGRGVMGIPIDHVLVSPGWHVVAYSVGPDLGSDHFPILVSLGI